MLPQNAPLQSFLSRNLPSSLSLSLFDFPDSLRLPSSIETSLTVRSLTNPTHPTREQKSVSSLSSINTAEFPFYTLGENARTTTPDPYHYPLRLDNQTLNQRRQHLSYHVTPVKKINISLHYSTITGKRELNRTNQITNELNFEVTVKVN